MRQIFALPDISRVGAAKFAFAIAHQPVFDSLSASSYGMYLVHYPIVVWLQFALPAVALGPIAKGSIVYVGADALSWGITLVLRHAPIIARVL